MARTKEQNARYYAARRERAIQRGFTGYREERKYKEETKEVREAFAQVYERETGERAATADPQKVVGLRDYYTNLMRPNDFIAKLIREGYSREDALELAREIYGPTP